MLEKSFNLPPGALPGESRGGSIGRGCWRMDVVANLHRDVRSLQSPGTREIPIVAILTRRNILDRQCF